MSNFPEAEPFLQTLPSIMGKSLSQDQGKVEGVTTNEAIEDGDVKKKKVPRRLVHCSDGIYEEYSTDEEEIKEIEEKERRLRNIDPTKLGWISWMVHFSWLGGSSLLAIADRWGGSLAWFFGITSPKYYYEIEEFKRMQEEEEERKKEEAANTHGWQSENQDREIEMSQPSTSGRSQPMERGPDTPEVLDYDPESQQKTY